MSDEKKALDWAAEILADSDTPSGDEFSWATGTNYGLDGFTHDQPMNEGSKDTPSQPGATPGPPPGTGGSKGMNNLPDGTLAASQAPLDESILMLDLEAGLHLGGMFTEGEGHFKDSAVIDLAWLDPTQKQDPERLPVDPQGKTLEALDEIWGQYHGKKSAQRTQATDLEVERYRQQAASENTKPGTPKNAHLVRFAVQKAVRDAHFGRTLADIQHELMASLGDDVAHTRGVVAHLKRDLGLMGNVFVRASAFPGIRNDKWVKDIKKRAPLARYVLTDDATLGTKLGMVAVSEIPWTEAAQHYQARMGSSFTLDGSLSPRAALQKMFLQGPEKVAYDDRYDTPKPIEVMPADTITTAQAVEQLRRSQQVEVVIKANDGSKTARAKALHKLAKWRDSGSLTDGQIFELRKLGTFDMLKQAAHLIATPKTNTYEGAGLVASQDAQMEREASHGTTQSAEVERLVNWTKRAMNEGWMGKDLSGLIEARWAPGLLIQAADELNNLRQTHEGLAGNIYVEAAAYASPTGVTGCKEASSKHRTNQVRRVLAMDRCSGCMLKQALPNGAQLCSVYNKEVIQASDLHSIESLPDVQKHAIRMANASDAATTGSLFSAPATSIVTQFGLQASMDVTLASEIEIEKLGEMLFDGMYLNEDD